MSSTKILKLASSSSGLFGRDDPEFLEALREVHMSDQVPTPVTKESSSSSELFGTEDSGFLEALSMVALPDDTGHSLCNATEPTNTLLKNQQAVNTLKRKLAPSAEFQEDPNASFMHVIGTSDAPSKDPTSYTDSDIYGPSKFHGFGEYMYRKRAKLGIQNTEIEESSGGKTSTLFQGLALHINGKTNPSVQELRKLIVQHGGIFHPYLDRKKMVTHIIASNLTPSKVLEFKNMKVVTPQWLLESIQVGVLLPWRDFVIGAGNRPDESQGKVKHLKPLATERIANQEGPNIQVTDNKFAANVQAIGHEPILEPVTINAPLNQVYSNPRPIYGTDPTTKEEASRIPSYAAHRSNPYAQRKMGDPQWRGEHTAVAPGFIEGYYRNSRLHHLSTWKAELQDLVAKAAERVELGKEPEELASDFAPGSSKGLSLDGIRFQRPISPKKGKAVSETQTIMHCDFDAFFVSAGLLDRPHLKDKAVVVCHSQGGQGGVASTSEIASSSYEARKFGIKNGMSLGQAKKLCSELHTIPYEFERYKRLSLQFYTILMSYADDLQAVSVDEALVDVTSTVENARRGAVIKGDYRPSTDFAQNLAETIRARVRCITGCEVSIGISHNILLARVATRHAKPAGSYYILPEEVSDILSPLDIEDLRGFGWSTRNKVKAKFGVTTLGELAKRPKGALCDVLGKKTGERLWKAVRGLDDTRIESDRVRKSVSCEINYGIRFENEEEAEKFVQGVATEVSERLIKIGMCGRSLTLKIMTRDPKAPVEAPKFLGHGICDTTNKTTPIGGAGGRATADETVIGESACRLLKGMHFDPRELRGIGIHVQKLERVDDVTRDTPVSPEQSILRFRSDRIKETSVTPRAKKSLYPVVVVDPPSQDVAPEDVPMFTSDNQYLKPDPPEVVLPSFSQVDLSFLEALPADIRAELELAYARTGVGPTVTGPSRHVDASLRTVQKLPSEGKKKPADIARITRQLAPKSRPSVSPTKMHPLFTKRSAPNGLKVGPAELKLLNIDADVWEELPLELQREQLAALRAVNVGTGMAVRASMSTQAKQERILSRWRTRRRSPSVSIKGQRPEIHAKTLQLPGIKQRGKSKSEELKVNGTEDIQVVISRWVGGFEEGGPRQGDVEYFGKFLTRCVETDVGAERAVSALRWWRFLLRQRWLATEERKVDGGTREESAPGQLWWNALWEVKARMDALMRKRYGGRLSLK